MTIDGRHGAVFERLDGPTLSALVDQSCDLDDLAEKFVELQVRLQAVTLPGIPGLVSRLESELARSGLSFVVRSELSDVLLELAAGSPSQLCHYDFHPDNIIVTDRGWVVIDWLTAANGPPVADLARSLLLRADAHEPTTLTFCDAVRRVGQQLHAIDDAQLFAWTRVLAGARLAEGFDGAYGTWLAGIASGA